MDEIHEQSREKLDAMFGIIEIRDRDLHKTAVAVADSVRTVARLLDKEDYIYRYDLPGKQMAAHQAAWRDYLADSTSVSRLTRPPSPVAKICRRPWNS